MSAALKQVVSGIEHVDSSIYSILNKLSTTQLQKLADDAGLYISSAVSLKDTVRLAYDVGDINPEEIFDISEQ